MKELIDITGNRYGRWTVLEETERHGVQRRRMFLCECECGTKKNIGYGALVSLNSQSCGCYRDDKRRGMISSIRFTLKKAKEVYEMFYNFEHGRQRQTPIVYLHDNKVKLYSGIDGLPREIYENEDYEFIYGVTDFHDDSWMDKKGVMKSIQAQVNRFLAKKKQIESESGSYRGNGK